MSHDLKTTKYGEFEVVIGVPDEYGGHRCEYAREYVNEKIGGELSEHWVIQSTIPIEPVSEPTEGCDYYRFGGNVKMKEDTD